MVKKKGRFRAWRREMLGRTTGTIICNLILYLVLIAFALVMLYPFVFVVIESLQTVVPTDTGIPQYTYNLSAYIYVITEVDGFLWSFIFSILISVTAAGLHVFFCVMTAYPLTKRHLKGRNGILLFIVFTMMFSGGMIPFYLLMRQLNLFDNPLIYILPGLITGYDVIIAKNFLGSIAPSLGESAQLDGAGEYRIFLQIYLPLSKPIMATIALWSFVGKWNDWMTGLLYMTKKKDLVLIQTFLRRILNAATTQQGGMVDSEVLNLSTSIRMAIIVVGMLPVVLMYPFVQKHFVKGVMLGSVKG